MRKTRRTTADLQNFIKEAKRQKLARHAQRKFASSYPPSPSHREATQTTVIGFPKAEDFIEFLCVRHAPFMSAGLELFAEPLVMTQQPATHTEIFECEDTYNVSDAEHDNESLQTPVENTSESNSKDDSDSDVQSDSKKNIKDVLDFREVMPYKPTMDIMKEFIKLFRNSFKNNEDFALISPPSDWKTQQYVQNDLKFYVNMKHIHRLKQPLCNNYMTLMCMKKQLESESETKLVDIPKVGLCEVDLPLIWETVNMFGGLETVNSDQSWKVIVDHLNIPKSAGRRVLKVEEIYLKYILPYDLLSDDEKNKLRLKIRKDKNLPKVIPVATLGNKMSLEIFHKMACNSCITYWKQDASVEKTEQKFWELIDLGDRHVSAVSGEIDLAANPQTYQRIRQKPPWSLQDLYSSPQTALKFLGKAAGITVPLLHFEGIFATKEWCIQEYDLHVVSYMHSGAEKIWYIIAREYKESFKKLSKYTKALITPNELLKNGLRISRCVQKEGEYVIIQPGCYYLTVATGYSCSEVVCYAPVEWLQSSTMTDSKLQPTDFIRCKVLLNLAIEESKKTSKSFYQSLLVAKMHELKILLSKEFQRMKDCGLEQVTCTKLQTSFVSKCSSCSKDCFLMIIRSGNENYCVDDAIRIVTKKKGNYNDLKIECPLSIEMIDSLLKKLKSKPSDSKRK